MLRSWRGVERMLYDELWEIVLRADSRLITAEYIALAICAFAVVAVLTRSRVRIWKRIGTIESRLSKMQSEIAAVLQVQAALIAKLNANSKVENDPPSAAVEMAGSNIEGRSTSPATPSSQPESAKSATLSGQ
jgi:hypothetical protein